MRTSFFSAAAIILLVAVKPCRPAFGSIAENLNTQGVTFYYSIRSERVYIMQCAVPPSMDLNPEVCQDVARSHFFDPSPMPLNDFKAKVRAWGQTDLDRANQEIAKVDLEVEKAKNQLNEIDQLIAALPGGSLALPDYQDRRKDISAKIVALQTEITAAKSKFGGFDLLFAKDGYLAQDLIHPIRKGENTYLSARPLVSHFYEAFKYRSLPGPDQLIKESISDFAQFAAMKPYCGYWNNVEQVDGDTRVNSIVRLMVTLNKSETYYQAKASCKALGLTLPTAADLPVYGLESGAKIEWPPEKSAMLFAASDLAKSLPTLKYSGRNLKIFWEVPEDWSEVNAFFITPKGDWFDHKAKSHIPGPYVDPNWRLSVVCEKQYKGIPRRITSEDVPTCSEYPAWQ